MIRWEIASYRIKALCGEIAPPQAENPAAQDFLFHRESHPEGTFFNIDLKEQQGEKRRFLRGGC